MLKRLFGGKKNKVESLEEAKVQLIEDIKDEALPKKITQDLETCLEFLKESTPQEIESFKESIFNLTESTSSSQIARAFGVYSNLLERVHITEEDVLKAVNLYNIYLEKSIPFFNLLKDEVKRGEEGDGFYSVDIDEIYKQLMADRNQVYEETAKSVVLIDALGQNLINILSADQSYIKLAKDQLGNDIKQIRDYNQSAYWIERLFDVLFDEPIVVIDVDNHIGIEAKMSGVSDNSQLHLLLMGLPELNSVPAINEQALAIAKGEGIHVSNVIVEYKWNMYHYEVTDQDGWEEIKIGPAKTIELQDFWIAGETTPQELSVNNGKRVILLGRTPVKRASKLQRSFKNMKASVEVVRTLSEEEINTWLKLG